MSRVIHLIPEDGLGGVEQAARSTEARDHPDLEVCFMAGKSLSEKAHLKCLNPNKKINDPMIFFRTLRYLFRENPEVLICSLWRASLTSVAFFILKALMLAKKPKLVVFVHSAKYAHFLDLISSRLAFLFAQEIWCDSTSTEDAMISGRFLRKSKVVSFFLGQREKIVRNELAGRGFGDFIFWGRITEQKRVCLALDVFKEMLKSNPGLKFYIYGPDSGDKENVRRKVESLGVSKSAFLMGEKKADSYPPEVTKCSFFLNLSSREGMAISVIEAMQIGLVPIVTPVGEIAHYCHDDVNSIYFQSVDQCVDRTVHAMNDEGKYFRVSEAAARTWALCPDYNMDLKEKYTELL